METGFEAKAAIWTDISSKDSDLLVLLHDTAIGHGTLSIFVDGQSQLCRVQIHGSPLLGRIMEKQSHGLLF